MQCILLAAGKGKRLNIKVTNKCLSTINNSPLIDYSLRLLTPEIFNEIIVVVGHNKQYVEDYLGSNYLGIKITYVVQEQQLGIAHAIQTAMPKICDNFMMCLSDEIIVDPDIIGMYKFFNSTNADCVCGITKDTEDNIKKAYTLQFNEDGVVNQLIEKPTVLFNEWRGTGLCMMKTTMLSVLKDLKRNQQRNEYEMGDWIQSAIDNGLTCRIFKAGEIDFNINEIQDMQRAEAYIKRKEGKISDDTNTKYNYAIP